MGTFGLAGMSLASISPNKTNQIFLDDKGMPSTMVYIPQFTYADVLSSSSTTVHPAFIVNGTTLDGIWIGKYQSCFRNDRHYSLAAQDPHSYVTHDSCVTYNRNKIDSDANNYVWHEITAAEWAALALWCHKNGCEPYGNNNYGKDSRESAYRAAPATVVDGKTNHTATGTGPLSWSHDKTIEGIEDLNGNVWEWCTGFRLVYGEVQIIQNNNAAMSSISLAASSSSWKAINASTGALTTPNGSGTTSGTVKLDYVNSIWTYSTSITNAVTESANCYFKSVTCNSTIGSAAKLLLQALAMLPDTSLTGDDIDADYGNDRMYAINGVAERCLYRGGSYSGGASAGVFAANLSNSRSGSYAGVGGRSALYES